MFYMICSIVCSGLLVCGLRVALNGGIRPIRLNASFRFFGGVVVLLIFGWGAMMNDFPGGWKILVRLGLVSSLVYWLASYSSVEAQNMGHLGISTTVTYCSMIVPTLASIIYWRELSFASISLRTVMVLGGVLFICGAMCLLGFEKGAGKGNIDRAELKEAFHKKKWLLWLSVSFVTNGLWGVCMKMAQDVGGGGFMYLLYMACAMGGAGLISLPVVMTHKNERFFSKKEIIFGVLLGLFAVGAVFLKLRALKSMDGFIVFPITSIGVILLSVMAGKEFFGEKTGKLGMCGIVAAIIGICLITIKV